MRLPGGADPWPDAPAGGSAQAPSPRARPCPPARDDTAEAAGRRCRRRSAGTRRRERENPMHHEIEQAGTGHEHGPDVGTHAEPGGWHVVKVFNADAVPMPLRFDTLDQARTYV